MTRNRKIITCRICNRELSAIGFTNHMRYKHPDQIEPEVSGALSKPPISPPRIAVTFTPSLAHGATGKCPVCTQPFYTNFRSAIAQHFRGTHPTLADIGRRLFGSTPVADWDVPKLMVQYDSYLQSLAEPIDDLNTQDPPSTDPVKHPSHYGGGANPYEAIKVIQAWNLDFELGNVLKYIYRAPHKGTLLMDLYKAKQYLQFEIEKQERKLNGADATA